MTKITVIPIQRRKTHPIEIDDKILHYDSKAKILGMTYTTWGLHTQVNNRRRIATGTLQRLRAFRQLSTKSRLRLFKTIVRPQFLYPITPLHSAHPIKNANQQIAVNPELGAQVRGRTAGNFYPSHENSILMAFNLSFILYIVC